MRYRYPDLRTNLFNNRVKQASFAMDYGISQAVVSLHIQGKRSLPKMKALRIANELSIDLLSLLRLDIGVSIPDKSKGCGWLAKGVSGKVSKTK